jgi:hypothetical protein
LPSAVDGEARVSRGSDAPLRIAFGGGVFEAKATATHRNKVSRPLPRPDDVLLQRQRRGRGVLYRSPGPASRHLFQVMLLLPLFFTDAKVAVGVADGGRLDVARSPLGGAGRRWCAWIQELEELGRGPGRWATADGSIPSSRTGVYFDSSQSQPAMELLQLMVAHGVFFGGGGRRRRLRAWTERSGSEDLIVISFFFRVLSVVWRRQLFSYPPCASLYLYAYLYAFLIQY